MKITIAVVVSCASLFALGGSAGALTPSQAQVAHARTSVLKASDMTRYRRRGGGMFAHWCAYNCYAISPHYHGPLGAYGYRFLPYDQDIPTRYRWDHDASPVDNALGSIYPFTGEPGIRAFETIY
jgi:hypothetical protein